MFGRIPSRVARDNYMIANPELILGHVILTQLRGASPLESPCLHLTLRVGSFDLHE
jgi:hypothetical protein